jgi:plasmid stabilization system protein ParE
MSAYLLSEKADSDISDVWLYIASDSTDSAERVQAEIYEAFRSLARMPGMGHTRRDLTQKPALFFPIYSYLIVYRTVGPDIEIVAVLSAYRNLKRILKERL